MKYIESCIRFCMKICFCMQYCRTRICTPLRKKGRRQHTLQVCTCGRMCVCARACVCARVRGFWLLGVCVWCHVGTRLRCVRVDVRVCVCARARVCVYAHGVLVDVRGCMVSCWHTPGVCSCGCMCLCVCLCARVCVCACGFSLMSLCVWCHVGTCNSYVRVEVCVCVGARARVYMCARGISLM